MTEATQSDETPLLAVLDLVKDDCSGSCGTYLGVGLGCFFGVTILKFWLINGIIDFSTALVLGTFTSTAGLAVRLAAYVFVVPFFFAVQLSYYLLHLDHRSTLRPGRCQRSDLLSLDWFTVGVLVTGLPLALREFGPLAGMNAVFLVGLFVIRRFVKDDSLRGVMKLGSIVLGSGLFLYANDGGRLAAATALPTPAAVLGPVATFRLSAPAAVLLSRLFNSLATGPRVVAGFSLVMNGLLTHPVLKTTPSSDIRSPAATQSQALS